MGTREHGLRTTEALRSLHRDGRFDEAAHAFEEPFVLSRWPALWWSIYLARRDAGDTALATEVLRRYLATATLEADERSRLQERLRILERHPEYSTAMTPEG